MQRVLLAVLLVLLGAGTARALEFKGVQLEPSVAVGGRSLQLNGYGVREKFIFDIYVGSLYTARPAATTAEALAAPGPKLIRMDFLYREVEREKIVAAFAEGLEKNTPQVTGTESARAFLGWFVRDFRRGDVVDLVLGGDGTVLARHNGTLLGSLVSRELARGVLLIYLGDRPADAGLKAGMLGIKR